MSLEPWLRTRTCRQRTGQRKTGRASKHPGLPWDNTDRDYLYEELLGEGPRQMLSKLNCNGILHSSNEARNGKGKKRLLTWGVCGPLHTRPCLWDSTGEQPGAHWGEAADDNEAPTGTSRSGSIVSKAPDPQQCWE